jgi:hypothetical protein
MQRPSTQTIFPSHHPKLEVVPDVGQHTSADYRCRCFFGGLTMFVEKSMSNAGGKKKNTHATLTSYHRTAKTCTLSDKGAWNVR